MKTPEQIIDKYYDLMFTELCQNTEEEIHELLVEYKDLSTGKTIRRSWLDRDKRLSEDNEKVKVFEMGEGGR